MPDAEIRDAIVLVLDALPAKALSCYGAAEPTTPEIDRFAAGSLLCEAAYAPASYTLSSIAGLFTSLRPAALGVLGVTSNVLPQSEWTLAEAFRDAGSATAAFSCNGHVCTEAAFDQGFDAFHFYPHDSNTHHAVPDELFADFWNWWDGHSGERRFAYVHLLPPHQPYDPPPPYDEFFGADAVPREEVSSDALRELAKSERLLAGNPRVQRIRLRYLAGLRYVDSVVGEWLRTLEERGDFEHTAVVLLSDHGEAFGEHGRILHTTTVYSEMTRVPLVMRLPGYAPRTVTEALTTLDVGPTLCELLGVPWAELPGGGRSLVPLLGGRSGARGSPVVSRSGSRKPMWALRTDEWSLVLTSEAKETLLFDRRADPGEQRNVASEEPAVVAKLGSELERILASDEAETREPVGSTSAQEEELSKIGYGGED